MREYFFITGLPRTRTAWLANFFTSHNSFCYHEAFKLCEKVEHIKDVMHLNRDYVGDSDCSIPLFIDELMGFYKDAKLVLIKRKESDVINSLVTAFPQADPNAVRDSISDASTKIEGVIRHKPLTIEYDNLSELNTIIRIWEHCIPNIPFDYNRWDLLKNLIVTVKSDYFQTLFSKFNNNIIIKETI